ncbi:spore coat protein [Brevibacillus humidisoli]|uniref:spore coat protein n=1 Tax=Brevibacillus humidisoli TaxID=2895522 RepID=UPI001E54DF45|nr:spore coat protein [Brevibacillus humidisoli]UFJ40330.1 spore coat protein [Brevibacillus humidisoli]
MRQWAAHELMETTELLRKLTADIEFHAFCAEMTSDHDLQGILRRHIQTMDHTYHQAVNLLHNKGADLTTTRIHQVHGQHHPHMAQQPQQMMPAPNTNATRKMSDLTISTLILNSHKAGSMLGMLWANECVDPDIRSLHVLSANNCQQMAYEIWQYMNAKGYYEAPVMPAETARTMTRAFQPTAGANPAYTGVYQMM